MIIQRNYTDTVFTEDHLARSANSLHVFSGISVESSKSQETVLTSEPFSQHCIGFTIASSFSITFEFNGIPVGVIESILTMAYEELFAMYTDITTVFPADPRQLAATSMNTVFMEEEIAAHSDFTSVFFIDL